MKSVVGWILRGRQQTRQALDDHTGAIQMLQHEMVEARQALDRVVPAADAMPEQLRAAVDDLAERITIIATRLDALEARIDATDR